MQLASMVEALTRVDLLSLARVVVELAGPLVVAAAMTATPMAKL